MSAAAVGDEQSVDARRVAIVTGASSGFGHAIALDLAAHGWRVSGTSRQGTASQGAGVESVTLDVTDDALVASAIARVFDATGRIDAVVNNAGFGIAGALEDTSASELTRQLDTNLVGLHRVCRAVLPIMRRARRGHIVNMSSLAGRTAIPFQGAYSASKFAIEAYSEALRMEVAEFGIRVAMIEPGDFATGFTARREFVAGANDSSAYRERCTRAVAQMARDEQANLDLSPVVRACRLILESRHPRLRYPRANTIQTVFNALRPYLPDALVEYLVADTYGLR